MYLSHNGPLPAAFRISLAAVFALALAAAMSLPWRAATAAEEDEHTVEISIKDHKFEPNALKLPVGKPIRITVKNLDATPEEFESKDLNVEKVIAGNTDATVRLKPLKPGTYVFYGEYHEDTALGHIVAE